MENSIHDDRLKEISTLIDEKMCGIKHEILESFTTLLHEKDKEIFHLKKRLITPSQPYSLLLKKLEKLAKETPSESVSGCSLLEAAGQNFISNCGETPYGNTVKNELFSFFSNEIDSLDEDTLWYYIHCDILPETDDKTDYVLCDKHYIYNDLFDHISRKGEDHINWLEEEKHRNKSLAEIKDCLLKKVANLSPETRNSRELLTKEVADFVQSLSDSNINELFEKEIFNNFPPKFEEAWEAGEIDEETVLTDILVTYVAPTDDLPF